MAKITSAEQLSVDIAEIFSEIERGTITGMNKAVRNLANKGRNAVKRNARALIVPGRRKYSNGWQYKMLRASNKWAAEAVIYAGKQPGLAHLLENGHAKVTGGRTRKLEHIKPVEEQIKRDIVSEVMRYI